MRSLKLIVKLVLQQLKLYPGRALVTIAGIVASACAVVWVVSGYDALVSQFDENAGKYLGRYDLLLVPQGPPGTVSFVDRKLMSSLQSDAGVLELNPVHQSRVTVARVAKPDDVEQKETALGLLIGSRPPVFGAPPIEPVLVGTGAAEPPYEMLNGQWIDQNSIVVSSGVAEELNIRVGDEVLVTSLANQLKLTVSGIMEQAPEAPSFGGPSGSGRGGGRKGSGPADRTGGGPGGGPGRSRPKGSDLAADPNSGPGKQGGRRSEERPVDASISNEQDSAAAKSETPKLGVPTAWVSGVATNAVFVRPEVASKIVGFNAQPTVLQIALRDTVDAKQFSETWTQRLTESQPPMSVVDFSTVRSGLQNSRNVSSQQAQAYAATGFASLAAVFIIFSLLSMGVSERTREFALLRAVALSRSQIAMLVLVESAVLAIVGWLVGLLAGYLIVAVGAMWMPSLFTNGAKLGWTCVWMTGVTVFVGAIGAALIPAWKATRIQPADAMSLTGVNTPRTSLSYRMFWIGLLLAASAPLTVFVLPIPDSWRVFSYSFFTYPALVVGIVLLTPSVVVFTEKIFGRVLAHLFFLNAKLLTTQLSNNLWRTIGATLALSVGLGLYASTQTWGYSMLQPFLPGAWLPEVLVSFQPRGLDDAGIAAVRNADGVDSNAVAPLAIEQAKFDWGDTNTGEKLKYDNAVVFGIDSAQMLLGSSPMLSPPFVAGDRETAVQTLSSESACIISEDFAHVAGLQIGDTLTLVPPNSETERVIYRVGAIVRLNGWHWITKFSGVRRHFVRTACMIFADKTRVMKDFHLDRPEFCWINLKPEANLKGVEAQMQTIAEQHAAGSFDAPGIGQITSYRPFARSTATETVRRAITLHADGMIRGMSQLPLITLFIMSLAVVNTVIASVRSRQWEFGILRAVGASRSQLVRLVVAETLMIGIAACLVSLIFGVIAGWCGVGMAAFGTWSFFQGTPTLLIPWSQLAFGFTITILLCIAAAVWPAWKIGRSEPLSLLSAGRSAR